MSSTARSFDPQTTNYSERHSIPIIREDGVVRYIPGFLSTVEADELLDRSLSGILWSQEHIKLFGKSLAVPRLSAWFSNINATYKYSGLVHRPQDMPEFVHHLLRAVVAQTAIEFNSILVNLYQDGNHSMGWHADNEPELGLDVTIASLSVGAEREFRFRHRSKSDRRKSISVAHGSLIIMYPPTQEFWLHELPKRKGITSPRVNFSFREIRS